MTPGFLSNGIDFEQLVGYYLASNCYVVICDYPEVNLVIALMNYVIEISRGYNDEGSLAKTIHGRFQMIFNSTLQELIVREYGGLIKRSGAVWLLNGHYEKGADFRSSTNVEIETKVYGNEGSMKTYAKKGSEDYTVFHGAEYVLCYLINSYEGKHWYWLKKIDGIYTVYCNEQLEQLTSECLPASIPVCYCKLSDDNNKLIIGKNTYCS